VRIGIPREVKIFENRVAMTPSGVCRLIEEGHSVVIETGAGRGAGFPDADYRKAGARIGAAAKHAWASDLVLKVKEPQVPEYRFFRPGLTLFTFLHLAANPRLERELVKRKVNAIPYEMVRDGAGGFPILAPMSEIAGCLAALIGANYLRRDQGGKGTLLTAIGNGGTGHATILGAGHVGKNALRVAHGLGATVTVFDKDSRKLEAVGDAYRERIQLLSDPSDLPEILERTDLLIGAILIPGKAAPKIVTERMVRAMEPGSVIIDVSIDQGGCIATSRPTTILKPVFRRHGVLHYGVTNMPSLVPRTATEALARATLPRVLEMASDSARKWSSTLSG
jgi:alanine dehydrogenase